MPGEKLKQDFFNIIDTACFITTVISYHDVYNKKATNYNYLFNYPVYQENEEEQRRFVESAYEKYDADLQLVEQLRAIPLSKSEEVELLQAAKDASLDSRFPCTDSDSVFEALKAILQINRKKLYQYFPESHKKAVSAKCYEIPGSRACHTFSNENSSNTFLYRLPESDLLRFQKFSKSETISDIVSLRLVDAADVVHALKAFSFAGHIQSIDFLDENRELQSSFWFDVRLNEGHPSMSIAEEAYPYHSNKGKTLTFNVADSTKNIYSLMREELSNYCIYPSISGSTKPEKLGLRVNYNNGQSVEHYFTIKTIQ